MNCGDCRKLSGVGRSVAGMDLTALRSVVASVAARDDALPMLTGVRLRGEPGGPLSMIATDRYRLAIATLPWAGVSTVDAMVPAALLVEAAKQASSTERVALH